MSAARNRQAHPERPTIMRTRQSLLIALAALTVLLTGCGSAAEKPTSATSAPSTTEISSGVDGSATVTGCPAIRQGTTCPELPVAAKITVTPVGETALVGETVSDAHGKFTMALPPGTYELRAGSTNGAPVPFAAPQTITVHTGQYSNVAIEMDSGIR